MLPRRQHRQHSLAEPVKHLESRRRSWPVSLTVYPWSRGACTPAAAAAVALHHAPLCCCSEQHCWGAQTHKHMYTQHTHTHMRESMRTAVCTQHAQQCCCIPRTITGSCRLPLPAPVAAPLYQSPLAAAAPRPRLVPQAALCPRLLRRPSWLWSPKRATAALQCRAAWRASGRVLSGTPPGAATASSAGT